MGLNINDVKISETKKRIDAKVEYSDFWNGESYSFDLRIVSKSEIESEVKKLASMVIDRKSEWRKAKKNLVLQIDQSTSAYIINFKDSEDE